MESAGRAGGTVCVGTMPALMRADKASPLVSELPARDL